MLQLLNPDHYYFTLHASATLFVGIALALLGISVVIRERASQIGIIFLFFTLSNGIWHGAFGFLYASLFEREALVWGKLGQVGVAFIPVTTVLLSVAVMQNLPRHRLFQRINSAIAVAFAISAVFTDLYVKDVHHYSWGFYPQYGPIGLLFAVYSGSLFLFILTLFLQELKRTTNVRHKKRLQWILTALSIGALASLDFLPSFGIPYRTMGYVYFMPLISIVVYVIYRYRLVDITPELAAGQILEIMHGAVIVTDQDNKVRVLNGAAQKMLGGTSTEYVGRDLSLLVAFPPELTEQRFIGKSGIQNHEVNWVSPARTGGAVF